MPKNKDKDDSPKHLKSKNKSSKKLKRKSSPPPNDDNMDDLEFQKVLLNLFPSKYQKDKTNKAKEALDKLNTFCIIGLSSLFSKRGQTYLFRFLI